MSEFLKTKFNSKTFGKQVKKIEIYKVAVNGKAEKVRMSSRVEAGDTIIVPRKIAGNDWISPIAQTIQSLASLFLMAFAVHKW